MHYPIIFRLLSSMAQVLVLALVLCFALALSLNRGFEAPVLGFALCILCTASVAGFFYLLGRNAKARLFRKEALSVIGLGWLMASIIGALPYWFILDECSFVDALFESVSGFTTTGATVFTNYEERLPRSLLFWRSLTQWIGGLGVVVLFVALVSNLGSGAKVLFSNESSGQTAEIDDSTMKQGASRITIFYLSLSGICFICYLYAGMDWFDAICHMLTTVSTGGFSTKNAGVPYFDNALLEWMMIFFMFMGGFSFLLALKFIRSGWSASKQSLEGVAYSVIVVGATALIIVVNYFTVEFESIHDLVRSAFFQVITIMTTTGYATEDFALWSMPAKWLLLGLMVIGGCSGSTAGGIKVIRILAAFRIAKQSIEKTFRTNVVRPLTLNGRVLDDQSREAIGSFLILATLVTILSTFCFSLLQINSDSETSLSAVVACLFNIGPGLGAVGPMENFAFLKDVTKIGLALLMLLGRLELYALLVLFSPSLWRKFR
jgi:trk system potassium uptake protein TrkH